MSSCEPWKKCEVAQTIRLRSIFFHLLVRSPLFLFIGAFGHFLPTASLSLSLNFAKFPSCIFCRGLCISFFRMLERVDERVSTSVIIPFLSYSWCDFSLFLCLRSLSIFRLDNHQKIMGVQGCVCNKSHCFLSLQSNFGRVSLEPFDFLNTTRLCFYVLLRLVVLVTCFIMIDFAGTKLIPPGFDHRASPPFLFIGPFSSHCVFSLGFVRVPIQFFCRLCMPFFQQRGKMDVRDILSIISPFSS